MSHLARMSYPARAAVMFFGMLVGSAIVISAGLAAFYVWLEETQSDVSLPPPERISVPGGIIIVPADTAGEFEKLAGFAPFIPQRLPATTDDTPRFAVTEPDPNGLRIGRVAFLALPGIEIEGIGGPYIVIGQARGIASTDIDGEIRRVGTVGRALGATMPCGDLVIDVQLYFMPAEIAEGEEAITPYIQSVAEEFIAGVKAQCGE